MARVLLIEDSPTQAKAIGLVLEAAGFEVATCESAEQGLERLECEIFDVVLSDLMLPGASGIDMCRRMHGNARLRQIPVVLLTGVDDESVVTRALREGAQDYLVKGEVNDKWVVRAVRHAIERKHSEAAPAVRPSAPKQAADDRLVQVVRRGDVAVARIQERRLVGGTTAEGIARELVRLIDDAGSRTVLVDLSKVEYLSNSAMGVLLSFQKRLQSLRGELHLCGLRAEVYDNVASRRLDRVFEIHEHEESALRVMQSQRKRG